MIELSDFQDMFEKHPVAHTLIDMDYNLVLMNDAFCKLTGYTRERLVHTRFTDFRDKGMVKYLKDAGDSLSSTVKERKQGIGQSTLQSPSGEYVVIRHYIPLFDREGTLKFIYVIYNDITSIAKNRDYMSREIDEFIKVYSKMSEGDLTARYMMEKPSDPDLEDTYQFLIKLREAVRRIVTALQTNIKDVNSRMQTLTSTAEVAQSSIEDASKGLNQISNSTMNVSENAVKSSQGAVQITKAMQDLSAVIEEICSNMESVSNLTRETNDLSHKGAEQAASVEKSMNEISDSATKVYEIVSDVENQMGEISKIVILIRELANQTNLLALNAAIEAARAGEAGRGFAVVATEVKSLAQESRNSAERIEEMIGKLRNSTQNASTAMKSSKIAVEEGAKLVTDTLKSFDNIATSIEKINQSASEVAAATEEQAATSEEITASIHEVSSMVDLTAKEANDTAAAVEELNAAIEEITSMVHTVNSTALDAMDANKRFKVD